MIQPCGKLVLLFIQQHSAWKEMGWIARRDGGTSALDFERKRS